MKEMWRRAVDWPAAGVAGARPLPQIVTPGACPAGAAVHFGVRGHGGLRRY